jgi:tetratricopeptide (TPR) repeat protein
MLVAGCPKRNQDFAEGVRAEEMQDYDTAIVYFERALRANPKNAACKLRIARARFEAGEQHIQMGRVAAQKSDLPGDRPLEPSGGPGSEARARATR